LRGAAALSWNRKLNRALPGDLNQSAPDRCFDAQGHTTITLLDGLARYRP
jgi:hypothetical protein